MLHLDCDPGNPGIEISCQYDVGSGVDVGVVLTNYTGSSKQLATFNFTVVDSDAVDLVPVADSGPGLNSNPDFNNSLSGTWACGPVDSDYDAAPAPASSLISCYSPVGSHTIPNGTSVTLATVHYTIPMAAGLGLVPLTLKDAAVFDETFAEMASCAPVVTVPFYACQNSAIDIVDFPTSPTPASSPTATPTISPPAAAVASQNLSPTPAGRYFAVDCDLATAGVQDDCTYTTDAGTIDVGVVLVNNGGPDSSLCCFNFEVHDPDTSRLNPPAGGSDPLDSNPDANQSALSPTQQCTPPSPDNDTGEDGTGTATSFLSCFTGAPDGPAIPAGGSLLLATVRYNIPGTAAAGTVPLSLEDVAAYDNDIIEVGSCAPIISEPATCVPATVHLIDPPAVVHKVPAGNDDNADLSIPAANLWICEAPAFCGGPGEGELHVVERAENVHTGDQNGDSIEDGLGAYEFTVEYDNFVIQSINPCDLVFGVGSPPGAGANRGPVDELDSSSGNPDCFGDAGPGANGTCSLSLVLENLVHFGCVTGGETPGPTGDFDLASLWLIPHPDLNNDLFPGNNNGVLTIIKDNGCELVDIYGHPVSGSVNGGLTPGCGDLTVTVRILEGDLNLDCSVDVTDAQLIASKYGGFFGSVAYSKWFDLEPQYHDLDIDVKDVQKVFGRQGSTCFEPIPAQPPLPPFMQFDE